MLKILLVEDDPTKANDIVRVLCWSDEITEQNVDHVNNLQSARARLRDTSYDLLLLDIVVPNFADSEPLASGGTQLLEEIQARPDRYRTPGHVVGITQFEEMHTAASKAFHERAMVVVLYARNSDAWERTLRAAVRHLVCARAAQFELGNAHEIELAVVCALPMELHAVRNLSWDWQESTPNLLGDPTAYFRGSFQGNGGKKEVVAAAAARMGMPAAAVLASKMIAQFRPRVLVMTGIAAGVPGKVSLGDVIVADPVWDYGSGKWIEDEGVSRFEFAPHQVSLAPALRSAFTLLAEDAVTLAAIRHSWPSEPPPHPLRLHVGPMASGAAVLADASTISRVVDQNRKTLAVEMEAYGVFVAADEAPAPKPSVIALKGIADFANSTKQDDYQRYCAFVSAAILRHAAERLI
jgi:nucleoside phosphorylase/CheY-like chemotaxis protein